MKTDTLKANWNAAKAKLKQKYPQLSDADLNFHEGREDELLHRLQQKTGCNRGEIEAFLEKECGCSENAKPEAGRDPNQRDWHEKRIEQVKTGGQKPMKNWDEQIREQRSGLGGNQQRTGSPTKDHNSGTPGTTSGHPADQDHGREAEQAKTMQGGHPRPGAKADESGQPGAERAAQRQQRPGEAGLANENRPGLGTRGDPTQNKPEELGRGGQAAQSGESKAQKKPEGASAKKAPTGRSASDLGADTSHPAPNEQNSNSLEQEQPRSTGMSGQSSGV